MKQDEIALLRSHKEPRAEGPVLSPPPPGPSPYPIAIGLAHRAGGVFAEAALAVEAANLRL